MSKRNFSCIEKEAYNNGYRILENGTVINTINNSSLKGTIDHRGYNIISIGHNKKMQAHRLQAYQKYGDVIYEDGIVVRHLNGNPLDNSINNIAIGTDSDNAYDIPSEKRIKRSLHATENRIRWDIKEIREMHDNGMSYSQIMEKTGITSKGTLSYIINKRKCNKQ